MICNICGEDINAIGMDNVSPVSGHPICENCISDFELYKKYWLDKFEQEDFEELL